MCYPLRDLARYVCADVETKEEGEEEVNSKDPPPAGAAGVIVHQKLPLVRRNDDL
jgi:hypothetical protein